MEFGFLCKYQSSKFVKPDEFFFLGGGGEFIDFRHIYVASPSIPGFNAFNFIPMEKMIFAFALYKNSIP